MLVNSLARRGSCSSARRVMSILPAMARQLAIAVALVAASGILVAAMVLATQVSGH